MIASFPGNLSKLLTVTSETRLSSDSHASGMKSTFKQLLILKVHRGGETGEMKKSSRRLRGALRVEEETLRRELANVSSLTSCLTWLSNRLPKISYGSQGTTKKKHRL
ncbi:Hypothetical predicted protein [Scomber scombrus]|uniref:Uncharacterized protein n=1 Tax=Scomber scombrus TaxID=13677 RepID=A0AAV1NCT6_SCOSC